MVVQSINREDLRRKGKEQTNTPMTLLSLSSLWVSDPGRLDVPGTS